MRSIRHIILFLAAVVLCVINIKEVLGTFLFVLGILRHFLWGGAFAFVVNIPLIGI